MQDRYVGDIGDFVKLAILRALSQGYRLGVIWWLFPDEDHNMDGRHVAYLNDPASWRHYDPELFDPLREIVVGGQRSVAALEAADLLSGATFARDVIPVLPPTSNRHHARRQWFETVRSKVQDADLVFVDPDNGLAPDGFNHGSAKAGKSVTMDELRLLARPGRLLIVYHHQTRRAGGHHAEIGYWTDRLRDAGVAGRIDALRARPYSPRVFFLLDAPEQVRDRAEAVASRWNGLIEWCPNPRGHAAAITPAPITKGMVDRTAVSAGPDRQGRGQTTRTGYVNRNGQEVIRPTGERGTDHGQYVYVLRCQNCGHEYGANGSDIWLRRCPKHDGGALGIDPE
jgi:hypothetical protein